MTSPACVILLTACLVAYNHARCPAPHDLPTLWPNDIRKFECARFFEGAHHNPALSCGGEYIDVYNGLNIPQMSNFQLFKEDIIYYDDDYDDNTYSLGNWNNRVRSFVVRPGCKLLAYEKENYHGSKAPQFTGVHSDFVVEGMGFWGTAKKKKKVQ